MIFLTTILYYILFILLITREIKYKLRFCTIITLKRYFYSL